MISLIRIPTIEILANEFLRIISSHTFKFRPRLRAASGGAQDVRAHEKNWMCRKSAYDKTGGARPRSALNTGDSISAGCARTIASVNAGPRETVGDAAAEPGEWKA